MTDTGIQDIINQCCTKTPNILICRQSISENVDFAKVWTKADYNNLTDTSPYLFYFIKDEDNSCVGAVLDMKGDLHWYIQPSARKKGHLIRALEESIFSHLARTRSIQRITINKTDIGDCNYIASSNTAKKAGFKLATKHTDNQEWTKSLRKYKNRVINPINEGMSFQRMSELQKKINTTVASIMQVQVELEMKLGRSASTIDLERITKTLEKYRISKLEDTLYDFNQSRNPPIVGY